MKTLIAALMLTMTAAGQNAKEPPALATLRYGIVLGKDATSAGSYNVVIGDGASAYGECRIVVEPISQDTLAYLTHLKGSGKRIEFETARAIEDHCGFAHGFIDELINAAVFGAKSGK